MKIGILKRNVQKVLRPKQAKSGLRFLAQNTRRTNVLSEVLKLNVAMGHFQAAIGPYILGEQFRSDLQKVAFDAAGPVGHHLACLAVFLKVKLPTSTKKIKITGTRTKAFLELSDLVALTMAYVDSALEGPVTKTVNREVMIPASGTKVLRDVQVIDKEAEASYEAARLTHLQGIITGAVDVYWGLVYDMFGRTPNEVFAHHQSSLDEKYGSALFAVSERTEEQKAVKAKAMELVLAARTAKDEAKAAAKAAEVLANPEPVVVVAAEPPVVVVAEPVVPKVIPVASPTLKKTFSAAKK